ncbi:MAG: hypothetical protein IPJ06_00615 [Saprospiraceae bacterium]|nr:hypothetical protein [Saprospiraceae bacterium]
MKRLSLRPNTSNRSIHMRAIISTLLVLTFFFQWADLSAQHERIWAKKQKESKSMGRRWLVSPSAEPFYIYQMNTTDRWGGDAWSSINYYYSFGAKVLTIAPKSPNLFGLSGQYSRLSYAIPQYDVADVTGSTVDVKLHYDRSFRQKLKSSFNYKLSTGLLYRYLISNEVLLKSEEPNQREASSALRNHHVYGMLGIGMNGFTFNNSPTGNYWELQVNLVMPFFGSGNVFSDDQGKFDARLDQLFMANTNSIGFDISWRQYLNVRKNKFVASLKRNDLLTKPNKIEWLRPPVCFSEPTRGIFGGLYFETGFHGRMDSVVVQEEPIDNRLGDLLYHNTMGLGYTFNFLGNYQKNQVYYSTDKGLRRNLYLSVGLHRDAAMFRTYDLDYIRMHNFNIVASAGGRLGFGNGYYLYAGYRHHFPIHQVIYSANFDSTLEPRSYQVPYGVDVSIGFRSALRLGVSYAPFDRDALDPLPFYDQLTFQIKIGN